MMHYKLFCWLQQ